MTRVIHIKDAPAEWRSNPDYEYIGRGSPWGNPYVIGRPHPVTKVPMTRDDVCDLYEEHTLPTLRPRVQELTGKILVCYCHPQRCHGQRVIHIKDAPAEWRSNPDYEYIGRGSPWGNPYVIGRPHPVTKVPMTRDDVCDLYEEHTLPTLRPRVQELTGKILVCYCHPQRCHGHSLARAVD